MKTKRSKEIKSEPKEEPREYKTGLTTVYSKEKLGEGKGARAGEAQSWARGERKREEPQVTELLGEARGHPALQYATIC